MTLKQYINKTIKEEVRKVRLTESFGDEFSTKGTSRQALQSLMDYLDVKDISYDFDGPKEIISFDVTELGRTQQEIVRKILKPVQREIKESTSAQEIKDLAIDLIDYMAKELPTSGWTSNKRILGFFQEAGLTDPNLIKKIYQTALKLNRE